MSADEKASVKIPRFRVELKVAPLKQDDYMLIFSNKIDKRRFVSFEELIRVEIPGISPNFTFNLTW